MIGRYGVALALLALGCGSASRSSDYTVIREFPHDTSAYTQGLLYADGWLYESTGRYGESEVRRVDLTTGRVAARYRLPANLFGEGLALLHGRLYQLTWKSQIGFVYDAETLSPVDSFHYEGEGWGLTTDDSLLIMSNGTSELQFIDPDGFTVVRHIDVTDNGSPLKELNELEYVDGELFANVYQSDWIVRVDIRTGEIVQWLDMSGLLPARRRTASTDVLNGIAFDTDSEHFLVTGKLWPTLFEVEFALRPPLGDTVRAGLANR